MVSRDGMEARMTVQRRSLAEAVAAVRAGEITEAGSVAALLLAQGHIGRGIATPTDCSSSSAVCG
jgi:hypothetical protein